MPPAKTRAVRPIPPLPDPAAYALPEELTRTLLSPALVVWLDAVRRNVRRVIERCGGAGRWRPHVKTAKIPEVCAELVRAGVRHFKCATTREAGHLLRVLDGEGVQGDVLLAYGLLGPNLARLGELAERHPASRVSVLCEDPARVADVPLPLSVWVDVNPGMDRTGIPRTETEAILAVALAAGDRFRGVHWYDGHFSVGPPAERRGPIFAGYDELLRLLGALDAAGLEVGEVVTSGTPTFLHALAYPGFADLGRTVHRVSPGTVVYHDLNSMDAEPDLPLEPAALVFARVCSHPGPSLVTCDAGSKALAAEAGHPVAAPLGHPELVARPPQEEHLPLDVTRGDRPPLGTELLLVPRHVCPTVNLAEEAVLIEDGRLHGIVPVASRAHEVR